MRFRFLGFGSALLAPLVLTFDAETYEAARESGLCVLREVTDCERAEIRGPGNRVELLFGAMPARRTTDAA